MPLNDSTDSQKVGDILVTGDETGVEGDVAARQELELLKSHMEGFLNTLKPRDLDIFRDRLLSEAPKSLQEIGDYYGVSRERVRQIETRLLKNLKVYMSQYIR